MSERCWRCGEKLRTKLKPIREGNAIRIITTEPVPPYCPNGCPPKEGKPFFESNFLKGEKP